MAKATNSQPPVQPFTTLSVTVFGGVPPQPIDVRLFKGTQVIFESQEPKSFTKTFDNLKSGSVYSLFITGRNPLTANGATKCELTTDQISLHPPDQTPALRTRKQYLVEFHFTV